MINDYLIFVFILEFNVEYHVLGISPESLLRSIVGGHESDQFQ